MADNRMPDGTFPPGFSADERHEQLVRAYIQSQNVAYDQKAPAKVPGYRHVQAGHDVLVTACPYCRQPFGIAAPGKQVCRSCGTWLEVEDAGK